MTTKVFRFNPESNAVTTGGFETPSDEWWRVTYEIEDGSLAYGGVTFASHFTVLDGHTSTASTGLTLSVPALYMFEGTAVALSATGQVYVKGNPLGDFSDQQEFNVKVAGAATIAITSGSGQITINGTLTPIRGIAGSSYGEIWINESTTVTASGTVRCFIEKYKEGS